MAVIPWRGVSTDRTSGRWSITSRRDGTLSSTLTRTLGGGHPLARRVDVEAAVRIGQELQVRDVVGVIEPEMQPPLTDPQKQRVLVQPVQMRPKRLIRWV